MRYFTYFFCLVLYLQGILFAQKPVVLSDTAIFFESQHVEALIPGPNGKMYYSATDIDRAGKNRGIFVGEWRDDNTLFGYDYGEPGLDDFPFGGWMHQGDFVIPAYRSFDSSSTIGRFLSPAKYVTSIIGTDFIQKREYEGLDYLPPFFERNHILSDSSWLILGKRTIARVAPSGQIMWLKQYYGTDFTQLFRAGCLMGDTIVTISSRIVSRWPTVAAFEFVFFDAQTGDSLGVASCPSCAYSDYITYRNGKLLTAGVVPRPALFNPWQLGLEYYNKQGDSLTHTPLKTFLPDSVFYSIDRLIWLHDGTILLGGRINDYRTVPDPIEEKYYLLRYDINGDSILWRTLIHDKEESNYPIQLLALDSDNQIYIVWDSYGRSLPIRLARLSADQTLPPVSNAPPLEALQVRVWPNPASDKIWLSAPVPVNIALRDISGRLVYHEEITRKTSVNLRSLSKGVYFWTAVDSHGNRARGKVAVW